MAKHLKTHVIDGIDPIVSCYVQLPPHSAPRARGVRYFIPVEGINAYWGAMDEDKDGRRLKKHIIVRRAPEHNGLLQLYTYHFPKHWSAACVANRELIKEAQRRAHALEHSHTREALEWRLRFWHHYYTVFKGGAKPEPGLKPYSRFYQYTYVAIYRELQAAQRALAASGQQNLSELASGLSFESAARHAAQHAAQHVAQHAGTIPVPFEPVALPHRPVLVRSFPRRYDQFPPDICRRNGTLSAFKT